MVDLITFKFQVDILENVSSICSFSENQKVNTTIYLLYMAIFYLEIVPQD